MNKVALIGRLTDDPSLIVSSNDKEYTSITLAVDRFSKGEKTADFIRIVAYGKQANTICNYAYKGGRLAIVGNIKTGSYEKDGKKVYTTDVVVEQVNIIDFLGQDKSNKNEPVINGDENIPF